VISPIWTRLCGELLLTELEAVSAASDEGTVTVTANGQPPRTIRRRVSFVARNALVNVLIGTLSVPFSTFTGQE
jgi:hypothetical protein